MLGRRRQVSCFGLRRRRSGTARPPDLRREECRAPSTTVNSADFCATCRQLDAEGTNDLLDTVLEQYTAWQGGRAQGQESQKPQKGPGKSGDGHKGFGKFNGNARRGHFAARSWNQKGSYAHYPDEPANKRSRAH
ncbi:unnamed protein product [Durusdinium trenchii]|uniref:RNA helicase n=1 Tax=Durusdinium trenchii TaxID=1381693 RepID=A0ABP0RTN4_9DINO